MSRPKFMVFKLSDLKIPFIMLLLVVAAFSFFMLTNNDTEATFAPDNGYQDGMYTANLAFSDASVDVVVHVAEHQISSITLDDFDENERILYQGLSDSISFINDYVTNTQSLELPANSNITASTSILMDAVNVALSREDNATLTTTYQVPLFEELTEDPALLTPTDDVVLEEEVSENTQVSVETTEVQETVETTESDSEN